MNSGKDNHYDFLINKQENVSTGANLLFYKIQKHETIIYSGKRSSTSCPAPSIPENFPGVDYKRVNTN